MPRFVLITLVLSICIWSTSQAQKTGEVDYPYLGLKFTIPEGWKGQETEEAFLIGSDTKPGLILLVPHEAKSIGQLEQEARAGIAEETVYLNMTGELNKFGAEGIGGEFAGLIEGNQVKAYIIGVVNPFGYGVSIMAATDNASYSAEYRQLAEQVASSLTFRRPKEPEKNKEWKQWISGAKLVYMNSNYDSGPSYGGYSTYSSYSSRKEILLCEDGSFSFYSSSQFSVDTGGGFAGSAGDNNGQGNWEISWDGAGNSTLKLNFSDGEVYQYKLTYEDSKTRLNGSRYFVIHDHGQCR